MGVELILGAAGLALGVIGNAQASSERKKSASAQRESNAINVAQTSIGARESRRQLLREERMRRARLLQGSFNAGAAGSSGESGALGAITTNVDNITSASLGETKANEGMNRWDQKALDYENKAREIGAWVDVFQQGINTAGNIWSSRG